MHLASDASRATRGATHGATSSAPAERHDVGRTAARTVVVAGVAARRAGAGGVRLGHQQRQEPRRRPRPATGADAPVVKTLGDGVTADDDQARHHARRLRAASSTYTDSIRAQASRSRSTGVHQRHQRRTAASRAARSCPIYKYYCPLGTAQILTVCTAFTEDDNVFAVDRHVHRLLRRRADRASPKQQQRVLADVRPDAGDHRQVAARPHRHAGSIPERSVDDPARAARRSRTRSTARRSRCSATRPSRAVVNDTIEPGLKKLGVKTGTDRAPRRRHERRHDRGRSRSSTASSRSGRPRTSTRVFLSGNLASTKQFVAEAAQDVAQRAAARRQHRRARPGAAGAAGGRRSRTRTRASSPPAGSDAAGVRRERQLEVLRRHLQDGRPARSRRGRRRRSSRAPTARSHRHLRHDQRRVPAADDVPRHRRARSASTSTTPTG